MFCALSQNCQLFFLQNNVYILNSGITGGGGAGGRVLPWHFSPGNFCRPTRKRGARKKRKMERKRRKIWKGRGGKLKMEGERVWKWEIFYFLFFLIFLFYFYLLLLFFFFVTFWNHWNLFGVYQNGRFLLGKSIFYAGKNQEKWLCPLWKIFLFIHQSHKKNRFMFTLSSTILSFAISSSNIWSYVNSAIDYLVLKPNGPLSFSPVSLCPFTEWSFCQFVLC